MNRSDRGLFKRQVIRKLDQLKREEKLAIPPIIPIYHKKILLGYLRSVTKSTLDDTAEIKRLAVWRKKHEWWFPAQFKVTVPGTKKWLKERLLETKDRFLFMIETPSGVPLGHIGLFRFDFSQRACEIDNVVRGENHIPGIMTHSIPALIHWARKYLKINKFFLEVFFDNKRAIQLYERCGFKPIKKIPLTKKIVSGRAEWVEVKDTEKAERFNLYMEFKS